MNSKRIILVTIICVLGALGRADDTPRNWDLEFLKLSSKEPYRQVGRQVFNLTPLSEYLIKRYQMNSDDILAEMDHPEEAKPKRPLPAWKYFTAKVVEIMDKEGLLLSVQSPFESKRRMIRLKNYPGQSILLDGETIYFFATEGEPFTYTTVTGAKSKIESYDYGKVLTTEEFTKFLAARAEANAPKTNSAMIGSAKTNESKSVPRTNPN